MRSDVLNLSEEAFELVVDSFLSDGILRDVPIVGTLVSLTKIGMGISDKILVAKIHRFIKDLGLFTPEDIESFKTKYLGDDFDPQIIEKLVLVIDRVDSTRKSVLLANLFNGFLSGEIDRSQFERCTSIVNMSIIDDLDQITIFNDRNEILSTNPSVPEHVLSHLFSIGLLSNNGFDAGSLSGDESGTIYQLNESGKVILQMYSG